MNILLIEDCEEKILSIKECLSYEIGNQIHVDVAKCLKDATRNILSKIYDLIIFDIYMPVTLDDGGQIIDISSDIIQEYTHSANYQCESIVITKYELSDIDCVGLFNENGVSIVHYSNEEDKWKKSLKLIIGRVLRKVKIDFLVFCALTKERAAYNNTDAKLGQLSSRYGMDCQDVKLDDYNGLCILPAKMGLVSMAISAAKAIELFQPKIVCMSGICAGVIGEADLLDLIVGSVCWEYQTGKFKDNKFLQEPYQANLEHHLGLELKQFVESTEISDTIKNGLYDTELKKSKIIFAPISSGSAVIADLAKMVEIGMQHRKMAGVEMEMYSLYEAADQSLCKPIFFGAKSVVDFGDAEKGDMLHLTASILSARFIVKFLQKKLQILSNNNKY